MTIYVGLDIAAKSVDLVYRCEGQNSRVERFAQTPAAHGQLADRLSELKPALAVMEATGVYYLDLAQALFEAGLPVAVINPKSFKHFAQIKLRGSKTDALDAALLAEYAQRMTPGLWQPPAPQALALRDIGRQINRLTGARTQAKNRLHALQSKRATPALLIEDETQGIAALTQRIERLSKAAVALLAEQQDMGQAMDHLTAAKGIAQASALALLAELWTLPNHLKAKQVTRYAGLDVRLTQSGSSLDKPGRLSKAGNAYLRSALYMPALSAVRFDPHAKAFYQALIARGKKKKQALAAVMRKYLTGLWACLQTNTPFDSAKLFSNVHFVA